MIIDSFMNMKPSHRKLSGSLCLGAVGALAFALSTGCGKSEAATSRGSAPESTNGTVAAAKAESDNYVAEIKTSGDYKAGAEGTVEVTLNVKGDYHINKQYPYKFKAKDPAPEGLSFPKPVLARADGTFEEKKGSFKVPFVAAKSGKTTVGGTLFLSVCSDANCVMDKVALEVDVDVK